MSPTADGVVSFFNDLVVTAVSSIPKVRKRQSDVFSGGVVKLLERLRGEFARAVAW